MKKINILCLLSLLVFTGCDDILDKGPLDTFTNTNFWKNEGLSLIHISEPTRP